MIIDEQKPILQVVLKNPEMIPDFLYTDYFTGEDAEKLDKIYQAWTKNPDQSLDFLEQVFQIDLSKEYKKADIDYCYSELEDHNLATFQLQYKNCNSWEEYNKLVEKFSIKYNKEKSESDFSSWEDIDKLYQQFKETVEETISSGFNTFDTCISKSGGWMKKGLYSILGLSGFGKSIFLVNFAKGSFLNKKKVLYVSTEMTEPEINERFFQSLTKQNSFEKAALFLKKTRPGYEGHFKVMKINPYECRVKDLRQLVKESGFNPEVIFIDYADELLSDIKLEKEYDAQGQIYARLKSWANDDNIPIITATQTNREAAGDKGGTKSYVGMKEVGDSSKKVRLVDGLYSIIQEPADKDSGKIYLQVVKNRKAITGTMIEFSIDYDTMFISDQGITSSLLKRQEEKKEEYNNNNTKRREKIEQEAFEKLDEDFHTYFNRLKDIDDEATLKLELLDIQRTHKTGATKSRYFRDLIKRYRELL